MYALITKAGVGTYTKTYQTTTELLKAGSVHWDDHPDNNMNDDWATVSTGEGTEVCIYSEIDGNGTSLTVPPNRTNFKVAEHGFKDKVASFQVKSTSN